MKTKEVKMFHVEQSPVNDPVTPGWGEVVPFFGDHMLLYAVLLALVSTWGFVWVCETVLEKRLKRSHSK